MKKEYKSPLCTSLSLETADDMMQFALGSPEVDVQYAKPKPVIVPEEVLEEDEEEEDIYEIHKGTYTMKNVWKEWEKEILN